MDTRARAAPQTQDRSYTPGVRGPGTLAGKACRAVGLVVALVLAPAGPPPVPPTTAPSRVVLAAAAVPQPAHVIVVIEENRALANIIGNKAAPFINALAAGGANMTASFAETHPSEPNYLALFAGSTFGVTTDACPVNAGAAPNLASELLAAGYTFAGFSEGLPAAGSPVCSAGSSWWATGRGRSTCSATTSSSPGSGST